MEYEVGKWYGWNGGECPVHPETVVEVCHAETGINPLERRAAITSWGSEKLIAFRIRKEHKEPREWWAVYVDKPYSLIGMWEDKSIAENVCAEQDFYKISCVREVI